MAEPRDDFDHVTLIATFDTGPERHRAVVVVPVSLQVFTDPEICSAIRLRMIATANREAEKAGILSVDTRYEWFRGDGTIDPAEAFMMNRSLTPLDW